MNSLELLQKEAKDIHLLAFDKASGSRYIDDEKLDALLTYTYETAIKDCLEKMGTHAEGEYLGYCDTGADMENAYRSKCTEMAMKRVRSLLPNNK